MSDFNSSDCISRQAAIEALFDWEMTYDWDEHCRKEDPKPAYIVSPSDVIEQLPSAQPHWIPCSERLPSKEECKEWIDNNFDGIGYLYPCLVTRYSSFDSDRAKNNPYVAKHYFDGEDFVNAGEEVCSEYIVAWMPLPDSYKGEQHEID